MISKDVFTEGQKIKDVLYVISVLNVVMLESLLQNQLLLGLIMNVRFVMNYVMFTI